MKFARPFPAWASGLLRGFAAAAAATAALLAAAALPAAAATTAQTSTLVTVYDFDTASGVNGVGPNSLILGGDGNFYGTTIAGGFFANTTSYGTVFRYTPAGQFTVLHEFNGTDGEFPGTALVRDAAGNLYGSTTGSYSGGPGALPTLYQIDPIGKLTTLHVFGTTDGISLAQLFLDTDGSLYGTTYGGGTFNRGTIFRLAPDGTFSTLHSFTGGTDGANSGAALVRGTDGNLYGTTATGGANGLGTIFKFSPANVLTTVHDFGTVTATRTVDGATPLTGLVLGGNGNFYGVTSASAVYDADAGFADAGTGGTIYQLTPAGALTVVYDGNSKPVPVPRNLVPGTDGNLYGTSDTALFQLAATDNYLSILYSGTIGQVVQTADGSFYGFTPDDPAGVTVDGTLFHLILGTPPAGTLNLDTSGVINIHEGDDASVTVHRLYGRSGQVTVQFTTANGEASQETDYTTPAQAGIDYRAASGTLTWEDGDSADKVITVPTIGQEIFASDYGVFFNVNLSAPTGGATLGPDPSILVAEDLDFFSLTSSPAVTALVNAPFAYQFTTDLDATNVYGYAAAGLPAGLIINPISGRITGTPTTLGTYPVTVTSETYYGDGDKVVTITVATMLPPVFTSAPGASGTVGQPFRYQVTTDPAGTLAVVGDLPAGLTFTSAGLLSGTPTEVGSSTVTFTATDTGGATTFELAVAILPVPLGPAVTPLVTTPAVFYDSGTIGRITLTLAAPLTTDLHVAYQLKGSAVNGTDYETLGGTATIRAGKVRKVISFRPLGDGRGATQRIARLFLLPGAGYSVPSTFPTKVKFLYPAR